MLWSSVVIATLTSAIKSCLYIEALLLILDHEDNFKEI